MAVGDVDVVVWSVDVERENCADVHDDSTTTKECSSEMDRIEVDINLFQSKQYLRR